MIVIQSFLEVVRVLIAVQVNRAVFQEDHEAPQCARFEAIRVRVIGLRPRPGIAQYLVNKSEVAVLQDIKACFGVSMKILLVEELAAPSNQVCAVQLRGWCSEHVHSASQLPPTNLPPIHHKARKGQEIGRASC